MVDVMVKCMLQLALGAVCGADAPMTCKWCTRVEHLECARKVAEAFPIALTDIANSLTPLFAGADNAMPSHLVDVDMNLCALCCFVFEARETKGDV